MDKHSDAFFSEAEVSNFKEFLVERGVRCFGGISPLGSDQNQFHHCFNYDPDTPVSILPSADQLAVFLEDKKHKEREKCQQLAKPYFTADSLPFEFSGYDHKEDLRKPENSSQRNTSYQKYYFNDIESSDENDENNGELIDELIERGDASDNYKRGCNHRTKSETARTKIAASVIDQKKKVATYIPSSDVTRLPANRLSELDTKAPTGGSGWHKRRSKSDIGTLRKMRNSPFKRTRFRRKSIALTDKLDSPDGGGEISRPVLRFPAVPSAAKKGMKQLTLRGMFRK